VPAALKHVSRDKESKYIKKTWGQKSRSVAAEARRAGRARVGTARMATVAAKNQLGLAAPRLVLACSRRCGTHAGTSGGAPGPCTRAQDREQGATRARSGNSRRAPRTSLARRRPSPALLPACSSHVLVHARRVQAAMGPCAAELTGHSRGNLACGQNP